jgi:hypothetical protein
VVDKLIIRNFNLIDIKKYEYETGYNILSFFNDIRFEYIIDLISLGNGRCSEELAGDILDRYMKTGKTLIDAMLEIKEALIGQRDNTEDTDDTDTIDISEYNSLTDLYINFSMQLLSVGLSYSEFWSMNTKEMYRVFDSICIKIQNETNRELNNYHTLAAMIGGAVWGKLQKEPPRIEMIHVNRNKDIDDDVAIMNAKLKSIVSTHNKNIKNKEG